MIAAPAELWHSYLGALEAAPLLTKVGRSLTGYLRTVFCSYERTDWYTDWYRTAQLCCELLFFSFDTRDAHIQDEAEAVRQ